MKISELIKKLETIQNEQGDLFCTVCEEGFGGEGIYTLSERLQTDEIYYDQIIYNDNEIDEDMIKEIFPDFLGNCEDQNELEEYCNSLKTDHIKVLQLNSGSMIYST